MVTQTDASFMMFLLTMHWDRFQRKRRTYSRVKIRTFLGFLGSTFCISMSNTEKSSKDTLLHANFKRASDEVVFKQIKVLDF